MHEALVTGRRLARRAACLAVALIATGSGLAAQVLYKSDAFELSATEVRQGPFRATAVGREQILATYPRAAREVHFKFALNGRDNEFPPGIEHTINLRPQRGVVVTPGYVFGVPPRPSLPEPVMAPQAAAAQARVSIRLDLRAAKDAIARTGSYVTPRGDTLTRIERVTVIGDTDPFAWDINSVAAGTARDLTDRDGDGIYETTLEFATEFLRPVNRRGQAVWTPKAAAWGPQLTSNQPLLDALYRLSLDELAQLIRPDAALAAGAKWPGVWTRDVALATLLGLPFVAPDAVKASLRAKVDATGRIIQDTGTGGSWPISTDRLTWALAAWELYAVTGDGEWLRESYAVIERSVTADRQTAWDASTGLVRGESSFLDWREQSYPRWMQPADIAASPALGTNAVHLGARQVLARMARAMALPSSTVRGWETEADTIRAGMRRWLWDESASRHHPFIATRLSAVTSAPSERFEALGEAMAMLTGATAREDRASVLAQAPLMPFGVPTLYPFIPGVPNYHNGSIWPFVGAYWMWAGAEAGHGSTVEHGIATTVRSAALFLTNKENLVAATGHFEGTALNSDRQLWSVGGQLAVQYRVLFGLRAAENSLAIRPMVPPAYAGERRLSGLRYRGADVTVIVRGFGDAVARATLNGAPVAYAEIPADRRGNQILEVELNGRWPQDTVGIVAAAVAPDTPMQPGIVAMRGDTAVIEWPPVEGAVGYRVLRNGTSLLGSHLYPEPRIRLRATDMLDEVQVVAVAESGLVSFPSEPLRLLSPSAELRIAVAAAVQRLSAADSNRLRLEVRVPSAGRYAIEAFYANGNGPINTEDKAAIRSLFVDGVRAGVLVMPQRGAGNWSEFGWSTSAVATLSEGVHELALAYTPSDRNMNGALNETIVREVRLTRIKPTPVAAPSVVKVEPPNWWLGHSVNPVRILVRGRDLQGAQLSCAPLRCSNVRVSESGTYVFADVEIPTPGAAALVGTHAIGLETAGGRTTFDFMVSQPLERQSRFAGIGADDLIYFVMPDRFADGDTTNNDPTRSRGMYDRRDPKAYHGGDLEGLRQRLPHLRRLGVTAIWMTPLYDNVDTVAHRMRLPETGRPYTDYHGYGATDLYSVDEHLGDLASLRRLVDDAHAAGIKIMLDQVANHTGPEHVWANDPPTPTWYNGTLARHLPNNWKMESLTDSRASAAVQDSTLRGWFADILPDFNQDDPEVERYLIQNSLWWVGVSGADALRQDTWPYVHRRFWRPWMAALKREYPALTVVGELWSEDVATVAFFEGTHQPADGIVTGVDQLFDFPLQAASRRVFARGEEIRQLAQVLAQDRLYNHPERLVTFLENHDMPRLPWDSTATTDGLLLAYTFLYTVRGIPKLYYGNEIGMTGGGDPDNRRDFPGGFPGDTRDAFSASGRTSDEQRIYSHLEALAALREARPDLRRAPMEHLFVAAQQFVYRRGATVVALNNANAAVTIRVPGLRLNAAAALGACARARLEGDATVIELPARGGCVF